MKSKITSLIVRLYNGRKCVRRYTTNLRSNWKKIYGRIASAGRVTRYYIRVEYGKQPTAWGTREIFWNEYEGGDKQDAKRAFAAFLEHD